MYALRRMYSSNEAATGVIKRIHRLIQDRGLSVAFEPISSARNPADRPSRGAKPERAIVRNAFLVQLRVDKWSCGRVAGQDAKSGLTESEESERADRVKGGNWFGLLRDGE